MVRKKIVNFLELVNTIACDNKRECKIDCNVLVVFGVQCGAG